MSHDRRGALAPAPRSLARSVAVDHVHGHGLSLSEDKSSTEFCASPVFFSFKTELTNSLSNAELEGH